MNAKKKGTPTVKTSRWSESNTHILLKITNEEQLTMVAHNLAQAVRQNSIFGLPNKHLKEHINSLEKLF